MGKKWQTEILQTKTLTDWDRRNGSWRGGIVFVLFPQMDDFSWDDLRRVRTVREVEDVTDADRKKETDPLSVNFNQPLSLFRTKSRLDPSQEMQWRENDDEETIGKRQRKEKTLFRYLLLKLFKENVQTRQVIIRVMEAEVCQSKTKLSLSWEKITQHNRCWLCLYLNCTIWTYNERYEHFRSITSRVDF